MPLLNEHTGRVNDPNKFQSESYKRIEISPGVYRIMGCMKGRQDLVIQSYRFNKKQISPEKAQQWLATNAADDDVKFEEAIQTHKNNVAVNFEMTPFGTMRTEQKDGKEYFVVPVVMMVEGVHNGIFYSSEELGKFPEAWNGQPVVIRHPEIEGTPVSANASPDMMELQVGKLFNTNFGDAKLKSEIWAEKDKMEAHGQGVLSKWAQNIMINVSIGAFEEDIITTGTWGSEAFTAIATNLRPDHLALLPDDLGACSIADGAGCPRVNAGDAPAESPIKKALNAFLTACGVDPVGVKDPIKIGDGPEVLEGLADNELFHDDIRSILRTKLRERFAGTFAWLWVDSVNDSIVIYSVEVTDDSPMKYFELPYTKNNDEITLDSGAPTEVIPTLVYTPVTVNKNTNANPPGGNVMEEKVNALISNQANQFGESDREWLSKLTEVQLDKMAPTEEAATPATPAAAAPVVNSAQEPSLKDVMAALTALPETINAAVDSKLAANARQPILTQLTAEGTKCPYGLAVLSAMSDEELMATQKQYNPLGALALQGGSDFSGMAGLLNTNAAEDGPGDMPSVVGGEVEAK